MYYTVTAGRARLLDRLDLLDRSTYGVDWLVLEANSAREAVRQWGIFRAGTHPRQAELEAEVAAYRTNTPGYQAAWAAESDIVASEVDRALDVVEERRRDLDEMEGRLWDARSAIVGDAGGGVPSGPPPRRRRAKTGKRSRKPSASRRRRAA